MKPRRWFRLSLRTMFVLVTLFGLACWVGVQAKWVRDRERFRDGEAKSYGVVTFATPTYENSAPWSIRIFGGRGYPYINLLVNSSVSKEETDRLTEGLKQLFPEARVLVRDNPFERRP